MEEDNKLSKYNKNMKCVTRHEGNFTRKCPKTKEFHKEEKMFQKELGKCNPHNSTHKDYNKLYRRCFSDTWKKLNRPHSNKHSKCLTKSIYKLCPGVFANVENKLLKTTRKKPQRKVKREVRAEEK